MKKLDWMYWFRSKACIAWRFKGCCQHRLLVTINYILKSSSFNNIKLHKSKKFINKPFLSIFASFKKCITIQLIPKTYIQLSLKYFIYPIKISYDTKIWLILMYIIIINRWVIWGINYLRFIVSFKTSFTKRYLCLQNTWFENKIRTKCKH